MNHGTSPAAFREPLFHTLSNSCCGNQFNPHVFILNSGYRTQYLLVSPATPPCLLGGWPRISMDQRSSHHSLPPAAALATLPFEHLLCLQPFFFFFYFFFCPRPAALACSGAAVASAVGRPGAGPVRRWAPQSVRRPSRRTSRDSRACSRCSVHSFTGSKPSLAGGTTWLPGPPKVCLRSPWRICQHWVGSAGFLPADGPNPICCSRSNHSG